MPIRSRVFKKYVLSYFSVVLAVCLALGLALVYISSRQLKQAETEVYQTRLNQTGDYIERQLSAMEDVRLDIKTHLTFQPFYFTYQKVNEVELVDAFSRYISFSPWIEEYYLWYQDEDRVFGSRSTYSGRIFFQEILNGMTEDALVALFPESSNILFKVLPSRPDSLMIAMPFYFGTARISTGRCVLFFFVKMNQLRRTIWQMTGQAMQSGFLLEYEGQTMLSTLMAERRISGSGSQQKVNISIEEPDIEGLERLTSFNHLIIWVMLLAVILGTCIAVYAAWQNYRPIWKLYTKYSDGQKPRNELQTLEDLLGSTLSRNTFSQKKIEEQLEQLEQQRSWLKQQLVMMLISGNDSPVMKELIQKMGFDMPYACFALCFLYIQGETSDCMGLIRSIEDFSDDECTLYAAELQEKREYIVLMNFREEEQIQEILGLLSDALESRNLSGQLQLSRTCNQLNEISSAAIEALNSPLSPLSMETEIGKTQEEDSLEQLTALIESGSTSQALALLENMIDQTQNSYPSYLMRAYMLNRLTQQVMALASRKGLPLPQEPVHQDPDNVFEMLGKLVRAMCCKAELSDGRNENGKAAAYVREHCLEADISLTSTANALGVSTKQVSRLLRMEVDLTFKEYLLQLRMSAAQSFLQEKGLSIAETANQVGYFNISHFIKCFKAYTGMTPGEWKKMAGREEN